MRFRLIYSGELKSNQRDPVTGQRDRLADHKFAIRREFHKQLKHHWSSNWFLSSARVYAKDYGATISASDNAARWGVDENERVPLANAVAHNHELYGCHFVPLVRKEWRLTCSLEILFLRHDPPGSIIRAGDLDNRVKTLVDALRMPASENEMALSEPLTSSELPFYCLLEDDDLISGLSVDSDRLLYPPTGKNDEHRRQVHVVVTVKIKPIDVTMFNLSFA